MVECQEELSQVLGGTSDPQRAADLMRGVLQKMVPALVCHPLCYLKDLGVYSDDWA